MVRFSRSVFSHEVAALVPFSGLWVTSLTLQGRGVFGSSLGGLGSLGRGTLFRPGSQGRLSATFRIPSSVANTCSPSELLPLFCPGVSFRCFRERLAIEGCHRTGILRARLLQWPLPPLFLVVFLFPVFLKPRLGVPLPSLLPSVCVMYSFFPIRGFHWARWLLRVLWFDVLVRLSCSFSILKDQYSPTRTDIY